MDLCVMNLINKKYIKYLPSKKFMLIIGSGIVLLIIIYVIFFMASPGQNFSMGNKEKNTALKVENQNVTDLIAKDTDGDGVPDWEEALWGTDPGKKITFNNTPDATYIENKKKALNIEESVGINEQNLSETDKFAREFFSSYTAMKSSGQADSKTINDFSNALGQKIVNPDLIDRYSSTDVKIDSVDTAATRQRYYKFFRHFIVRLLLFFS